MTLVRHLLVAIPFVTLLGPAPAQTKARNLPVLQPVGSVPGPVGALAYAPDGKRLAAGSYRDVVLLDADRGDVLARISHPEGKVTALAFRGDGQRLAVAAGQAGRVGTVHLYGVAEGLTRERVLDAHKDLIHALAFSPDGKLLATTGYDRLIKIWATDSGKEVRTLRDHSDAVYAVCFSPDGKLLASAAADRAVKVWDVATGTRLYTLGESTDWVYAAAWSPDGKHLAAGGVDKSIRVWEVDAQGGKVVHAVFAHEGPVTQLAYAADGKTLYSLGEDRTVKVWDAARMAERHHFAPQPEAVLALAVRPDHKQLALGSYDGAAVLLDEATGKVQAQPLPEKPNPADRFPGIAGVEPNDSPSTGQKVALPVSISGTLARPGDVDYYRFDLREGQQVGVQVVAAAGPKLEPALVLTDPSGNVVAEGSQSVLGWTARAAGTYALGLRDREYRGGNDLTYRLHVGPVPVVTAVFPPGVQRGTEKEVKLEGVFLTDGTAPERAVRVKVPAEAKVGARFPISVTTPAGAPLGDASVLVGEFPGADKQNLPVPGTGYGRIHQPGHRDTWTFPARQGQRLLVEIHARRGGSPLDSTLEILDAQSRPVPRATLRSVAKTYVTFRDHDSAGTGMRIESWSDIAINDYLYVGSELVRIFALPKNPDDDCQFYSRGGQRVGFLDTTPTHHPQGKPMYKVQIHPPGATFPPNGYPVFPLVYRNDDGGPGYGKDSRLFFDAPADGTYRIVVGDARGQGGANYVYALTVRPPRPDYAVTFTPTGPSVWRGGAVPVTVTADRADGFEGAIEVRLENLPPGFRAPVTTIPAGENATTFALYAGPQAVVPPNQPALRLATKAILDGREVSRAVPGGALKVVEPGDIVTTTDLAEVTVQPGKQVWLTAKVERRNGFKGRIPLEVRGLPHGVRVLDIGLNGILITEKEGHRAFAVYCEPWVAPTEHPFVVLARREGKGTEHAAPSVLLKVRR